jgi:hypothetical protein
MPTDNSNESTAPVRSTRIAGHDEPMRDAVAKAENTAASSIRRSASFGQSSYL